MSNPLQLQMLLGGKISASDWHHTSQDPGNIQKWHIKFLEKLVPKAQKILHAKGIQTRPHDSPGKLQKKKKRKKN